ncbi:MAG: hypothetical protein L0210_10215 [Rhodospirillales bacterium]|nr:hypothetical protein [Rhodospirillales bacterium]
MDSFDRLVSAAFALDPGVRWVAVTRPGDPPRWRYRSNVQPRNDSASDEAEERLVNPAILALAGARGDWDLDGLRYVAIAYGKLTQVIAGLPAGGHISLSLDRRSDPTQVGDAPTATLASKAGPQHNRGAARVTEYSAAAAGKG